MTAGHAVEGLDMFTSARSDFVLEHWFASLVPPTYCGVRSLDWMYVRYNRYEEPVKEGLYYEVADPFEMNNLAVTDPSNPEMQVMRDRAATLCQTDGNAIYPNDWPYSCSARIPAESMKVTPERSPLVMSVGGGI